MVIQCEDGGMEPTIPELALIVVDRDKVEVEHDRIYLGKWEGSPIRRAIRHRKSVLMACDNPEEVGTAPIQLVDPSLVIGQVVGLADGWRNFRRVDDKYKI